MRQSYYVLEGILPSLLELEGASRSELSSESEETSLSWVWMSFHLVLVYLSFLLVLFFSFTWFWRSLHWSSVKDIISLTTCINKCFNLLNFFSFLQFWILFPWVSEIWLRVVLFFRFFRALNNHTLAFFGYTGFSFNFVVKSY